MARAAAIVFIVALALRLGVAAQLESEPLFRTPQLDALEYFTWGARIASGDLSWDAAPIHGPGYPYFLGGVLAATRSLVGLRMAQAVLGSIAAVLVLLIARRLHGRNAGLAAGLLHAAYAPLILIDVSILAEGLLLFLLTATLWLMVKLSLGDWRAPLPVIALTGLILGVAVVVRPTAAMLIPLVGWIAFRLSERKPLALIVLVVAMALPILPVILQNRSAPDPISGIQASGGMNFYIGNSPLHDGTAWARPGARWDTMRGMAWREGVRGAAAEDRFFIRQTIEEIKAHPMRFGGLLFSKAAWLIQNEEIRDSHSFHFFAGASPLLRWLPRFGVVFALAICGVIAAFRTQRESWPVAAYALLMAATFVLLVAGSRYRIPLMPALMIYAGVGVAAAIDALAARRTRTAGLLGAVFVIAIVVSHLRTHEESHDFSEELTMTALALKNEGRLEEALHSAQRAATLNPQRDAAWVAIGDIEATRNRWPEAEQAWQRASTVDPNNARAWSHLAFAHIRRGELGAAEEALRRALSIRAEAEALNNLAVLRRQKR